MGHPVIFCPEDPSELMVSEDVRTVRVLLLKGRESEHRNHKCAEAKAAFDAVMKVLYSDDRIHKCFGFERMKHDEAVFKHMFPGRPVDII